MTAGVQGKNWLLHCSADQGIDLDVVNERRGRRVKKKDDFVPDSCHYLASIADACCEDEELDVAILAGCSPWCILMFLGQMALFFSVF